MMETKNTIQERLRSHVNGRGGAAKDEHGDLILPNGAWSMMLEVADRIDDLESIITSEDR